MRGRMEQRDAMASQASRVCSNDNLVRPSRDIDVTMTEVLLSLIIENAIRARYNLRMNKKIGGTK